MVRPKFYSYFNSEILWMMYVYYPECNTTQLEYKTRLANGIFICIKYKIDVKFLVNLFNICLSITVG